MALSEKKISEILKKYKEVFEDLAHYDETREKRWGRERLDLTLDKKIILKLRELKRKTGKPVSRIVEEAIRKINSKVYT